MKLEKLPQQETISREPFPASTKIYVPGALHDIKVPMREIALTKTTDRFRNEVEANSPVTVYDTSGPFTDPAVEIDVRKGIPCIRQPWIEERGDTDQLSSISSSYGKERLFNPDLDYLRFEYSQKPKKAKP